MSHMSFLARQLSHIGFLERLARQLSHVGSLERLVPYRLSFYRRIVLSSYRLVSFLGVQFSVFPT